MNNSNKNAQNASIVSITDLKTVWRMVVKNWLIVLFFLGLSYALAVFYTYRLTLVYGASTQILLKSFDEYNPTSIISDAEGKFGNIYKSYVDNSNEKRVIRSYDLIEKAVKKLKLETSYFIQGRVKVLEVYDGTPFWVEVTNLNPSFYEKDFTVKIKSPQQFELEYMKNDENIVRSYSFNNEIIESNFRMTVFNSGAITKQTIKSFSEINYMFKIHSLNTLVQKYMNALTVENPEYTNILEVSVVDVIPHRALVFLDTLASVYIANTLKQRFEINENTQFYIERQMQDVVQILNSLEDTMQNFKETYGILDLPTEKDDYFEKLSILDAQKSSVELNQAALNALEDYIIQNKDPEFLPPSVYVNSKDEFLLKSTSELYNLQINRNELLTTTTENSMAIKIQESKIDMLKKNLLTYISNSREALKKHTFQIQNEMDKYISSIKKMPEKQRGLLNIERKRKVNEDMYLFLLQRRANTIISKAGILPLTKVIESPRLMGVVSPNKQRITLFFLGAGLIISLLIVFVRVLFYEKIESIDELKSKTDLPILGEILFNAKMNEQTTPAETDPRSPITESFRTIRTNLQYMSPDSSSKAVVITSNNPGEGKTFVAINLSVILAKANKKVLLLELDLHKPRVQKGLNMQSEKGLSTILINKDSIKESILNTPIANLDVILSGPIPPNASELVLSEKLKHIIDYGKSNYDFVIIDTPPVGLISDALVIMRLSDISIFVLNTRFAYKEAIANAHELVSLDKLKNFGFVLNGVRRKKSKYYYNRYAYGYGYGYGYGKGYGYGGYGSYGGGYGDKT